MTDDAPLAGGRIGYVFLEVRAFDAMLSFYRDALGLTPEYVEPGRCAFLRLGGEGPRVALYAGRTSEPGAAAHILVAIDVDDLDASVAALARRGVTTRPIEDVPGGRAAKFDDPEGNRWELHEHAPPEGA